MADTHAEMTTAASWSGGVAPYAVNSKKLGMWLFIISDALTFSAMLVSYSYSRLANPDWPRPFPFNPAILFSTTMTVVLLASSLTMVMGVAAAHRGQRGAAVKWLLATMAGGAIFVGLHLSDQEEDTEPGGERPPAPEGAQCGGGKLASRDLNGRAACEQHQRVQPEDRWQPDRLPIATQPLAHNVGAGQRHEEHQDGGQPQ